MSRFEQTYGAFFTYAASLSTVGVGAWLGENWFLALSAVAVIIRMAIDLDTLFKKKKTEKKGR